MQSTLSSAGIDTAAHDLETSKSAAREALVYRSLVRELELRTGALDAASTHFMITDVRTPGWPIVFVNRAVAHDNGYEPEELLGRSAGILVSSTEDAEALAEVHRAMRRGQTVRTQLRSYRKDGSSFWAGVTFSPMRDAAGVATHYVSIGADITARLQEAENRDRLQRQLYEEMQERERMAIELRLARKLESVGRLAAGVAHEINTPVQYVADSVRFLSGAFGEIRSLLDLVRNEVGRGTGQGLAIARSIVIDKHGGLIDVHSTVGAATRFVLKLPIGGRAIESAS